MEERLLFEKISLRLRLGRSLEANDSTLTPRKVFSATHMSRQKTNQTYFAPTGAGFGRYAKRAFPDVGKRSLSYSAACRR